MSIFKITFDSEQDGYYVQDLVLYVKGKTGLKEAYKEFRWNYRNLGEQISVTKVEEYSMDDVLHILNKNDAKIQQLSA